MKIIIERFKSIEKVEVDFSGIILLVGGNNSGKSSILQAIQFGVSAAQTAEAQGGIWSNNRLSTSIGQTDLLYSPLKDVISLARNGKLKEAENEAICITYIEGGNECKVLIKKGRNKNIIITMLGEALGKKLQSITEPFSSLVTGLAGIPAEEKYETPFFTKKAYARGDSNSVFRNILNMLKKDEARWKDFTKKLKQLFNDIEILIEFNPDQNDTILCNIRKGGLILPVDSCGTGVLQAIQLFAYTYLFQPKNLLLDEPDSHLHPNNQKLLSDALVKLSEDGYSIIISTHSKIMIESLIDNSNMIWVSNGKIVDPINNYMLKALIDIGALNEGDRTSSSKYIILTEDTNILLISLLLECNSVNLDDCEILSYHGCTKTDTATTFIEYLRKTNNTAKYIIHRDRDFLTDVQIVRYKDAFAGMDVKIFIPDGNDLESCFLSEEHLISVLGISGQDYVSILDRAITSRKVELQKKYINTHMENIKKEHGDINAGEISVEFTDAIEQKDFKVIHGKILLKGIRDVLAAQGIEDKILSTSGYLNIECLRNLSQDDVAVEE